MSLFDEAAEYDKTSLEPPFRGRERIRRYRSEATSSQRDISFSHEVLSVSSTMAVARWRAELNRIASGQRVELDRVFILTLNEAALCIVLREWWHMSSPTAPDA